MIEQPKPQYCLVISYSNNNPAIPAPQIAKQFPLPPQWNRDEAGLRLDEATDKGYMEYMMDDSVMYINLHHPSIMDIELRPNFTPSGIVPVQQNLNNLKLQ